MCISHFSYCTIGVKDLPKPAAPIVRCCLRIVGIDFAVPTLLFTSLFTIVLSINETNQNYQFRSVGTYAHGSFKDVDEVQITL